MARALRPLAAAPGLIGRDLAEPALAETAFLVEAVAAQPVPVPTAWWNVPAQAARVLDLVETLRAREAALPAGP